jgi:predicted MFS family arabinose efflux permease
VVRQAGSEKRDLWLLVIATYMFFSGMMSITSIVARYARFLGVSIAGTGVIFSLTSLSAALLRIPVGVAADRLGPRPFMALGGLSVALAGLVAMASGSGLGLGVTRIMQGVGLAFFVAPSIYVASMVRGVSVNTAVSLRSAAISAASITAPFIAGILVDKTGYGAAFTYAVLNAVGAAAASMLIRAGLPQVRASKPRLGEAFSALRRIWIVAVTPIVDGAVFLGFQSLPQANLKDLGYPATVFGTALSLSGATGLAARLSTSTLVPLMGCIATMLAGYALLVGATAALLVSVTPPWIYLSGSLYGAGFGFIAPAEQVLIVSNVEPRIRNTVLSMYTLSFDIGGFIGSTLLGAIAEQGGYEAGYTAMVLLQAASLVLVALWGISRKRLRTLLGRE